MLKSCADVFGPLITRLANTSFREGIFPDIFKIGQVTPLLKKPGADIVDMANYRPITNLNIRRKILERLAQKQLRRYIEQSPNVGSQQSAYRAFHSTETAMTKVVSDLLSATDRQTPAVLLALDISAAFDMHDHQRLLARATTSPFVGCSPTCPVVSSSSPLEVNKSQTVTLGLGYHRDLYSVRYFSRCLQLQSAR